MARRDGAPREVPAVVVLVSFFAVIISVPCGIAGLIEGYLPFVLGSAAALLLGVFGVWAGRGVPAGAPSGDGDDSSILDSMNALAMSADGSDSGGGDSGGGDSGGGDSGGGSD